MLKLKKFLKIVKKIMSNTQISIYSILGIIIVALCGYIFILHKELDNSKTQVYTLQANINLQNEKIKENEIKTTDTTDTKVKEKIITKYKTIKVPIKESTCEDKLRSIDEITNLYFYNHK